MYYKYTKFKSNAVNAGEEVPYQRMTLKARKRYLYIPVIPRVLLQYAHKERAQELQEYTRRFQTSPNRNKGPEDASKVYTDFWDSRICRELRENVGYLQDPHDLAFLLTGDGVKITQNTDHEVFPIFQLLNLHPKLRIQMENFLPIMVVPGPKQPKDLNSFLFPLIEELKMWG